jgi:hypothetical protein
MPRGEVALCITPPGGPTSCYLRARYTLLLLGLRMDVGMCKFDPTVQTPAPVSLLIIPILFDVFGGRVVLLHIKYLFELFDD